MAKFNRIYAVKPLYLARSSYLNTIAHDPTPKIPNHSTTGRCAQSLFPNKALADTSLALFMAKFNRIYAIIPFYLARSTHLNIIAHTPTPKLPNHLATGRCAPSLLPNKALADTLSRKMAITPFYLTHSSNLNIIAHIT